MIVYTIGFTQKSAQEFFKAICENKIQLLIDIRLNNTSQLAGFSKELDLKYFLCELCQTKYVHDLKFAPTKSILNDFKKNLISWQNYVDQYTSLIDRRNGLVHFVEEYSEYDSVCLLCSEPTPEHCHRGILADLLKSKYKHFDVVHI